jgi:hypothetical protein
MAFLEKFKEKLMKKLTEEQIKIAVRTLVIQYIESKAENFVVTDVKLKTGEKFYITVQNVEGKTPIDIHKEDEAEIRRLNAEVNYYRTVQMRERT